MSSNSRKSGDVLGSRLHRRPQRGQRREWPHGQRLFYSRKSLNFKIQIFWNNSVVTATHDGTDWTAQSSQYRAYNGMLSLMLNNFTDGFAGSPAGSLRASVYVGDTCHDSIQKKVTNNGLSTGRVGKQVELWVPAYQMLPDVEMSYPQNHLRDPIYYFRLFCSRRRSR